MDEHEGTMNYREPFVQRDNHRIYVREYSGEGPAIVLMHGFPDNLHLYDRLLPHLDQTRRAVTFDFLGWGASDKPTSYRYSATNQTRELDAVIDQCDLDQVVLVAHDASGPPAIDWALAHPHRVSALVLLNTYYCWMRSLRRPEAIFLYSTPILRTLARWVVSRSDYLDEKLFHWQIGRFIRDPSVRRELVPLLYTQFRAARPAFWALNDDLLGTVLSRRKMLPQLRRFSRPVRIVFGAADPYLNERVAKRFHDLFPISELFLLPDAHHYVQVDEPEDVGRLICSTPVT